MPALLDFRHVTVFRGNSESPALDDLSLRIDAGEHVCIFGPNGCGKSTLIKTITRECYPIPASGSSIEILGKDRWDVFQLRSLLGIASPDLLTACSTDATGRDIVISGFFSSTRIFPHHHPSADLLDRADRALHRVGVGHLASRPLTQMSSGEAQRTLIARALVHDPQTLLFDEPSNALDIAAQFQLRDAMRDLARSGIGILLVTHHVAEIIPEIDRILLLKNGRIVGDGPKHTMLTAPRLSDLFGVPVRVSTNDAYYHVL